MATSPLIQQSLNALGVESTGDPVQDVQNLMGAVSSLLGDDVDFGDQYTPQVGEYLVQKAESFIKSGGKTEDEGGKKQNLIDIYEEGVFLGAGGSQLVSAILLFKNAPGPIVKDPGLLLRKEATADGPQGLLYSIQELVDEADGMVESGVLPSVEPVSPLPQPQPQPEPAPQAETEPAPEAALETQPEGMRLEGQAPAYLKQIVIVLNSIEDPSDLIQFDGHFDGEFPTHYTPELGEAMLTRFSSIQERDRAELLTVYKDTEGFWETVDSTESFISHLNQRYEEYQENNFQAALDAMPSPPSEEEAEPAPVSGVQDGNPPATEAEELSLEERVVGNVARKIKELVYFAAETKNPEIAAMMEESQGIMALLGEFTEGGGSPYIEYPENLEDGDFGPYAQKGLAKILGWVAGQFGVEHDGPYTPEFGQALIDAATDPDKPEYKSKLAALLQPFKARDDESSDLSDELYLKALVQKLDVLHKAEKLSDEDIVMSGGGLLDMLNNITEESLDKGMATWWEKISGIFDGFGDQGWAATLKGWVDMFFGVFKGLLNKGLGFVKGLWGGGNENTVADSESTESAPVPTEGEPEVEVAQRQPDASAEPELPTGAEQPSEQVEAVSATGSDLQGTFMPAASGEGQRADALEHEELAKPITTAVRRELYQDNRTDMGLEEPVLDPHAHDPSHDPAVTQSAAR